MFKENFQVFEEEEAKKKTRLPKKITKQRLTNIALYYLKRFDTSVANLRQVLHKRINDYAYHNKDYDKAEAYGWAEEVIEKLLDLHYLDDERFCENRCRVYLEAGKPRRYIIGKLREKGIAEEMIDRCLSEQEYNPLESALHLAKKKKIAAFRSDDVVRKEMRQKDMGVLVRAGFDYDTVLQVLDYDLTELENI